MIFQQLEILHREVINMVKGISKQVIVIQSPDPVLFEQAIFILKEGRPEVTDEVLLEQANQLIRENRNARSKRLFFGAPAFALFGAAITGVIWLISAIL